MSKKVLCSLLAVLIFVTAGCGKTADNASTTSYYSSVYTVTPDSLIQMTTPANILNGVSGFRVDIKYENSGSEDIDNAEIYDLYCKAGGVIGINERMDFADGGYSIAYLSDDPDNLYYFVSGDSGYNYTEISEEDISSLTKYSILGIDSYDVNITSIKEENGSYVAEIAAYEDNSDETGEIAISGILTIDPKTGYVTKFVATYENDGYSETMTMSYGNDFTLDYSPVTDNGMEIPASDASSAAVETAMIGDLSSDILRFSADDLDGRTYTMDDFKDAKVIMVNYWEPWCGPCVSEMPDLEALYEKYKEEGLVILGVFTSEDMDESARAVLDDCGTTYPVVHADAGLRQYSESFVPSTIFVSPDGIVLTSECYVGAQSYDEWDSIISSYLK